MSKNENESETFHFSVDSGRKHAAFLVQSIWTTHFSVDHYKILK